MECLIVGANMVDTKRLLPYTAVIFLHPPYGINTPFLFRDGTHPHPHPPPTQCNFSVFFLNENFRFAYVYTPPNICLYPPISNSSK